jgi:agmatinase
MKRIHDMGVPLYQIGTRSYCLEEHTLRLEKGIPYVDAERLHREGLGAVRLPANFPKNIFISFDIDALDSSIMPATGTPVPGGMTWYQAMWIVESLLAERRCIGFDMLELAPMEHLHSTTFAAAQLVYNFMGYIDRSPHTPARNSVLA